MSTGMVTYNNKTKKDRLMKSATGVKMWKRRLSWSLENALIIAMAVLGTVYGKWWAFNIAEFLIVLYLPLAAFKIALILLLIYLDKSVEARTLKTSPMPMWVNCVIDVGLTGLLVAFGHSVLGTIVLLTLFLSAISARIEVGIPEPGETDEDGIIEAEFIDIE